MSRALLIVVVAGCYSGGAAPPDAAVHDAAVTPDGRAPLDVAEPDECGAWPIDPYAGDDQLLITALQIPDLQSSVDLDGDGVPDNKLAAIGQLSNPAIVDALADESLVLPLETFDHDADPDPCVKLAFYEGQCEAAGCDVVHLDAGSVDGGGYPISRLRAGATGADGTLTGGPGFWRLPLPMAEERLPLPVTVLRFEATLGPGGLGGARAVGVLQAARLDDQRGLTITEIGFEPEHSLADLFFANLFGPLLALPQGGEGCYGPDIDVDGDGLEQFCDSNPDDAANIVDVCVDGDGTIVVDGEDGFADCTDAGGPAGPRFVDGVSVAVTFEARGVLVEP